MGRSVTKSSFISENLAHPNLTCNDTEFMRLQFENNGTALLFITWAADLAVYDKDKNSREHIDILYMITNQGWRVTVQEEIGGKAVIEAAREGQVRQWPVMPLDGSFYDRFVKYTVEQHGSLPSDLVDIHTAFEDVRLVRQND